MQPRRAIKSFVLRQSRMTAKQRDILSRLWPSYGIDLQNPPLPIDTLFNKSQPLVLEIGFGMGKSLFEMAKAAPHKNFIGVEVHKPGVASLLSSLEREKIENVRLINQDVNNLLEQYLPDNCLSECLIYFPDPWPKKRHHKRRLIQASFIKLLNTKIQKGGILHCATDWEEYATHMTEVLEQAEGLENLFGVGQFSPDRGNRPETKFEARGKALGHKIYDLIYQKD